jgi:hypothetical protein
MVEDAMAEKFSSIRSLPTACRWSRSTKRSI